MTNDELKDVLNIAQAELRAMYRRCGIKGSNVLDKVEEAYAFLSNPKEPEAVHGNEAEKEVCEHPREHRSYIGQNMLRCNLCGKEFS